MKTYKSNKTVLAAQYFPGIAIDLLQYRDPVIRFSGGYYHVYSYLQLVIGVLSVNVVSGSDFGKIPHDRHARYYCYPGNYYREIGYDLGDSEEVISINATPSTKLLAVDYARYMGWDVSALSPEPFFVGRSGITCVYPGDWIVVGSDKPYKMANEEFEKEYIA